MDLDDLRAQLELDDVGAALYGLIERLYPICRSITGDGVRETLSIISEQHPDHRSTRCRPVRRCSTGPCRASGTFGPRYIVAPDGRRVVDFADSNLHVVGYSAPVDARMSLDELRPHLHSLPDRPDSDPVPHQLLLRQLGLLPGR